MAWQLDPNHTEVGFEVRHMMVSKVRGRFTDVAADIHLDEAEPANSRVEATIAAASVTTGAADRDGHLRSADFFDAEQYPNITFRSTSVQPSGKGGFKVAGTLAIRGVEQPVTLDGQFEGPAKDPWGNTRVGFSLAGDIDREAFGLTWNQALEAGGVLVAKQVKLQIDAQVIAVD
ncbi:MAG: YceI family protein [Dehalococcoidia bacterium]